MLALAPNKPMMLSESASLGAGDGGATYAANQFGNLPAGTKIGPLG